LHLLSATIVKKLTLEYALETEYEADRMVYNHGLELAREKIYRLDWKIAQMCWELQSNANQSDSSH
jgi:hypothetical protein